MSQPNVSGRFGNVVLTSQNITHLENRVDQEKDGRRVTPVPLRDHKTSIYISTNLGNKVGPKYDG